MKQKNPGVDKSEFFQLSDDNLKELYYECKKLMKNETLGDSHRISLYKTYICLQVRERSRLTEDSKKMIINLKYSLLTLIYLYQICSGDPADLEYSSQVKEMIYKLHVENEQ